MIKLGVTGAAGRMGKRITALAVESGQFEVVAALEVAGHPQLGQDAGFVAGIAALKVLLSETPGVKPEVLIDFSAPAGVGRWAAYAREHKVPLVVGTTGLSEEQKDQLKAAATAVPVLLGANMSLGVNLLFKLVAQVAARLSDDYDIEIIETHHRFKKDAPSGTALELARHIAGAKKWDFPGCLEHGREGKEALRRSGTIGMHAVRAGDTVGEHSVLFAALGETIELKHSAHTRDNFVRGALHAAAWLVKQKPGFYSMFDALGL